MLYKCLYELSCLKAYEVLSARQDTINTLRQSYLAIYFFSFICSFITEYIKWAILSVRSWV